MSEKVISVDNISNWDVSIPEWAKPTKWMPIEKGCLAKILPIGGPTWMNELVVILEVIEVNNSKPVYRVIGRYGESIFPYYALDIQNYPSGSINTP